MSTRENEIANCLDLARQAYELTDDEQTPGYTPEYTIQLCIGNAIVLSLLEVADAIRSLKPDANG